MSFPSNCLWTRPCLPCFTFVYVVFWYASLPSSPTKKADLKFQKLLLTKSLFSTKTMFYGSINFYFSCCAECGMSSINSGFECLCLSWATILWYLQTLNVGFSWLSTLVPAFSASSCATAWELLLPVPVSLSSTPSPLCSTATLWNCEQEENLPPIAVSFRFSWHKIRKVISLPWSRSFCQYPQYPSSLLAPTFMLRLLCLRLVLGYKPDLLLTTRLWKYSVPSFLFFIINPNLNSLFYLTVGSCEPPQILNCL